MQHPCKRLIFLPLNVEETGMVIGNTTACHWQEYKSCFNVKTHSYLYRIVEIRWFYDRPYLHNGISYTGMVASLYRVLVLISTSMAPLSSLLYESGDEK